MRARVLSTVVAALVLLAVGLVAPSVAAAAPPGNDTIAGASPIAPLDLPFTATAAVGRATSDAVEADVHTTCGEPATTGGVWYRFTASYDTALDPLVDAGGEGARVVVLTRSGGRSHVLDCVGSSGLQVTHDVTYYFLVFGVAPGPAPATVRFDLASGACFATTDQDFDGDNCPDLAVAEPGAGPGGQVDVLYGNGPTGLEKRRQTLRLTTEPDARTGEALTTGDVDRDGLTDLVVGVPRQTVGGRGDAGAVYVVYGSRRGLGSGRATAVLHEGTAAGTGTPETGDHFGWSVAVSATGAIAVGVPNETVGPTRAGAVVVERRSAGGWSGRYLRQGVAGVPGAPEDGDGFGHVVAWDGGTLLVGAPYEDLGRVPNAGVVDVVPASGAPFAVDQATPGMPGAPERNDVFGSALQTLTFDDGTRVAVGAPGEDVGTRYSTGVVDFLARTPGHRLHPDSLTVQQDTRGVPGTAQPYDGFGAVLAAATANEQTELVVGVPLKTVSGRAQAGEVVVVSIGQELADHVLDGVAVSQADNRVSGAPEAHDHFGASLASLPGDPRDDEDARSSIWAGVPGESVGALTGRGAVQRVDAGSVTIAPAGGTRGGGFGWALS